MLENNFYQAFEAFVNKSRFYEMKRVIFNKNFVIDYIALNK